MMKLTRCCNNMSLKIVDWFIATTQEIKTLNRKIEIDKPASMFIPCWNTICKTCWEEISNYKFCLHEMTLKYLYDL